MKGIMMIVKQTNMWVIDTQYKENYGAHDWDGEGECPQYWKNKGGSSIKVTGIPCTIPFETLRHLAIDAFTECNDYVEVDVIRIHIEHDEWLSDFEKSQLEYDGSIDYHEPKYTFEEFYKMAGKAIAARKDLLEV
jgi:hypothetical protein